MRTNLLVTTSFFAFVVMAFSTNAQAQIDPAPAETASADILTIEEVVVTAERRQSTAQKTAAAITVRSGQELLSQGRYQLKNILEDIPGVLGGVAESGNTSGTDNPGSGLTIRGIQSTPGDGVTSSASAAAIYVDEVYNGLGGGYDLDRVEVLRGPQGTLYGRSATSGVVAFHARDPQLDQLTADLTGEVGNYNLKHVSAALNLPLVSDKVALRASGNFYERDGLYPTNGGGLRRNLDGRMKILVKPTDNFSALLGFAVQDNKTTSDGVTITQISPDVFSFTAAPVGPGKNSSWQAWGVFKLDLDGVTVTYVPAYRSFKNESVGYARSASLNFDQTVKTPKDYFHTQELRISSNNDSAVNWQVGGLYYHNALSNSELTEDVDPVTGVPIRTNEQVLTDKSTTEIGVFAEGTWALTPSTRLTGGLRYDYTKIKAYQDYMTQDPFSLQVFYGTLAPQDRVRKFNNLTYKARIEHDLTPSNLIYASTSTGFAPGDVTIATDINYRPETLTLEAETLTAYEIGTKNRFFDNKLQINAAAYYYLYGGYQVANINVAPPPLPSAFTVMTLPVHARGVELEILARPWGNGKFFLGAEYSYANYHDVPSSAADYFSSNRVAGVPPFRLNTSYNHTIPLPNNNMLMLGGLLRVNSDYDVARIDKVFVESNPSFKPYAHLGWRAITDLNATLNLDQGRCTISAYVRNLFDTRFKTDAIFSSSGVTTSTVALNDPRTYGLVVGARF